MKIRELIKELEAFDQDNEVKVDVETVRAEAVAEIKGVNQVPDAYAYYVAIILK